MPNKNKDIYSTIKVQTSGRVVAVSLNRPQVRNAFDPQMIRELTVAFTGINARRDLAVVVLRGEGESFCAGADLNYMKSQAEFTLEENEADAVKLHEMFWTLRACPHPVIGRFHGHVFGGGLGLAAICDIATAVSETHFCFSEVKLGLVPAVISPFVLERMEASQARRYMLTGEMFGGLEALAASLVHFVGNENDVDNFVQKTTLALEHNGPESVRATKGLLRAISELPDWGRRRELTTKVIAERRVSAEGQEGLRGFLEKRAPSWRPQERPKA